MIDRFAPKYAVRVRFRVLDCVGYPVRPLTAADVSVINDEKGEPFGAGSEGGGASAPDVPSDFGMYSMLALDMSDSIFNNNVVNDVIDGAKIFVQKLVAEQDGVLRHKVGLMVFGRTDATKVVMDFTDDANALAAKLEELRSSSSLGTTNLYGAFMTAIDKVSQQGHELDVVERSVVILTDGTHEAGNEEELRSQALGQKGAAESQFSVTAFSIGIKGAYDETKLAELASKPDYFVLAENAAALAGIFDKVAERVEAIARSNYVVGVCTPVELGSPSLTIKVQVDGVEGHATIAYSTADLNGDVANCDEELIAAPCKGRECGPGALLGFNCGSCGQQHICNSSGQCEPKPCVPNCTGIECGDGGCPDQPNACGCPGGLLCLQNRCIDDCQQHSDCPTDYFCKAFPEGDYCGQSGNGKSGEKCTWFGQCADYRVCLFDDMGGYCANYGCETDWECPLDAWCVEGYHEGQFFNYCAAECDDEPCKGSSDFNCQSSTTTSGNTHKLCLPIANGI